VNREAVSDWIQILATIGVIAGLIMVAFELRQNTVLARAEMNSQMLFHQQSLSASLRNQEFAIVFNKSLERPDALSGYETIMMDGYYRDLIGTLIRERQMISRGIFADDSMLIARLVVSNGLGTAYGQEWWSQNKAGYRGSLVLQIDEALEQARNGLFRVNYERSR